MFRAVYCVITLWSVASVYALIKPVYEDDPELYKVWTTPKDDSYWARYTDGAQWVGNLMAGRAEFPWLLDVRTTDDDQEIWSVGNLLDHENVLTCCRSVMVYKKVTILLKNGTTGEKYSGYLRDDIRVSFAPTYLWENYKPAYYKKIRPVPSEDQRELSAYLDSGTRLVKQFHVHPRCGEALAFDLAVLRMTRSIKPIIPIVQYMGLFLTRVNGSVTDPVIVVNVDIASQVKDRVVCYVGSYGRDWRNLMNHIVIDYKLRYRAYYEPMQTCFDASYYFELNKDRPEIESFPYETIEPLTKTTVDQENTYCFITRARVGTVCDHDRGGPVVCDGKVFGFVVRGSRYKYCNNLLPMPFIVVKIGIASQYYESAIDAYDRPVPRHEWEWQETNSRGVVLYHPRFYLYTFLIILYMSKTQFFPQ